VRKNKLKHGVYSAMFAAIIFVSISFISVPDGLGGVVHFGDALIYIAATTLPFPYALIVAALGPGLFNLLSPAGLVHWLPFTIIIKPLMAMCFTSKGEKILGMKRNIIAPIFAGIINTGLYFIANVVLFSLGFLTGSHAGTWAAGIAALPGLLIQSGGSVVFYFIIAHALDRLKIKKRIA